MHCNNFGLIGLVLFICVHSGKEKMGRDRSCNHKEMEQMRKSRQLKNI